MKEGGEERRGHRRVETVAKDEVRKRGWKRVDWVIDTSHKIEMGGGGGGSQHKFQSICELKGSGWESVDLLMKIPSKCEMQERGWEGVDCERCI